MWSEKLWEVLWVAQGLSTDNWLTWEMEHTTSNSETAYHAFQCFFLKKIFIYLLAVLGLHCCAGFSLVVVRGFSLQRLLLLRSRGSREQAQQLWCMGLVAPRHVGSSQTGYRTCVSCIGRQVRYHWATKGSPSACFLNHIFTDFHWDQVINNSAYLLQFDPFSFQSESVLILNFNL